MFNPTSIDPGFRSILRYLSSGPNGDECDISVFKMTWWKQPICMVHYGFAKILKSHSQWPGLANIIKYLSRGPREWQWSIALARCLYLIQRQLYIIWKQRLHSPTKLLDKWFRWHDIQTSAKTTRIDSLPFFKRLNNKFEMSQPSWRKSGNNYMYSRNKVNRCTERDICM